MKDIKKSVKFPCRGCIYSKECGENTRIMPCDGRMTKREKAKKIRE